MNRLLSPSRLALAVLALTFSGCGKEPAKTAATPIPAAADSAKGLESVDQKVSYGVGYNMGRNLNHEKNLQVDKAAFQAGFEDGLGGAKTRIPEADLQAAFTAIQQKVSSAMAAEAQKQLAAGNDFLAKNKARPGVKTTPSGLQYEVLVQGVGRKPKVTDTVRVHYQGSLIDGTVFDSSIQRGQPIEFAVNGVIAGWTEALQMMPVGSKWKLFIPPSIAYGPQGKGDIPPNSVLVFEVELLAIK